MCFIYIYIYTHLYIHTYIYIYIYTQTCILVICSLLHYCTILWTSLVAQMVKNLPTVWETQLQSLGSEDVLYRTFLYHYYYFLTILDFPGGSQNKESACNAGDLGLIPE